MMLRNTPVPFFIGFEWMIRQVVFEGHKLVCYIMCCTLTQLEYNIEYKWKRCQIQQPHNVKTKPSTRWNTQLCLNLELFPLWHLKKTITKSQNKVFAKFLLTSLLFKCSSITTPSYSSYNDADDNCVKTTKPTTHYIYTAHITVIECGGVSPAWIFGSLQYWCRPLPYSSAPYHLSSDWSLLNLLLCNRIPVVSYSDNAERITIHPATKHRIYNKLQLPGTEKTRL